MDILSHGLWGGVALGRTSRRDYWWAFFFGIAPDFFVFGPHVLISLWNVLRGGEFMPSDPKTLTMEIPAYTYGLYDLTHSLIVFTVVFFLVWTIRKKPFLPMLAWPLHICVDIFTHSTEFFPTPFLWPLVSYRFNGIPWVHPIIFIPNVVGLLAAYGWWYRERRHSKI